MKGAPPGARHGMSKLTGKQVREIRWRYANEPGATHLGLAMEYDISVGTIGPILRGRTWKHLL